MDLNFETFKPLIGALETAGLPVLKVALSAAVTGVAGPAGLLVDPAINIMLPLINQALGIPEASEPAQTASAVAAATPGQIDALKALQENDTFKLATTKEGHAFDLAKLSAEHEFALASQAQQLAVTTAEISNPSLFVGGWRPAVCWGLGGLLLTFKALPIPVYVLQSCGFHLATPPDMDFGTFTLISSLLGVAIGFRSLDKHLGNDAPGIGGTATVLLKRAMKK